MKNQMKKQERITKKHIAEILEMPLESILETAKIHADEHARLGKNYQDDLEAKGARIWNEGAAAKLRMIGRSQSLHEEELKTFLPAQIGPLVRLAPLPIEFLRRAVKAKQLHPDMTEADCIRLNHMFRNNWGNFDPAYEMPERVLVNASNESKTWREEMVQFLRDAPDAEYNSEAVYYLERLIGENQDEHRSLEDALALAVSQVKWMEAQVRQRAAITEKVRRVMANATKTKAAKARV